MVKLLVLVLHSVDPFYSEMMKIHSVYLNFIKSKIPGFNWYKYIIQNDGKGDRIDHKTNTIIIDGVNETLMYRKVRIKIYRALQLIKDFDFDYVVRINESSVVNFIYLRNMLHKNYIDFGGKTWLLSPHKRVPEYNIIDDRFSKYAYVSGRCIILSKKSINLLLETWNNNRNIIYDTIDDISIAQVLSTHNIFAICPSIHFNYLYNGLSFDINKKNYAFLSHNSKDYKKTRENDPQFLRHTISLLIKLMK